VANYGGDPSEVHAVISKSYIVFGKQDTDAVELSAIAAGKGGFIIKGNSTASVSCLPNTTYDVSDVSRALIIKSSKPSPLIRWLCYYW
jgi:hypothetical protein